VGTLKPKADEFANLQYFAWLAFMGQATSLPGESMNWCSADGWLQFSILAIALIATLSSGTVLLSSLYRLLFLKDPN
jgi:hypothetical protein